MLDKIGPQDVRSVPFQKGIEDGVIERINPFNAYIDTILSMIDVEAIKQKNLKSVKA